MSDYDLKAIVNNTVLLGTHVKELKKEILAIKDNQKVLKQDIVWLGDKLDKVIQLLEQNSR